MLNHNAAQKKQELDLEVWEKYCTFAPAIQKYMIATGCSAVGSVPGLGPGCRRFESCHPDR